jgi:uncharacterized protein (TIGR00255 family)
MIQGMTGFGRSEVKIDSHGTLCVELRSTNHKFLETVLHLPEGFLLLEDRAKKEIEAKLKRGRVTCVITIFAQTATRVGVNKALLDRYIAVIKEISRKYRIKEGARIDTLVKLPGVLELVESRVAPAQLWPALKKAIGRALNDLLLMRRKEGKALYGYLKHRIEDLAENLGFIQSRFKKVIQEKISQIKTDPERSVFLKEADITEEIERLIFHAGNFKNRLNSKEPIGKELDFIAQEMQREANTMGAKSCDIGISARVVQIKSQIEKLREQVQNVE